MAEHGFLLQVIVILLAAILAVPLFRRFRLGSVLGYLVAGMVIGPFGFGLATEIETINAIAELGVVFLLFTVGLELPLERLKVIGARMFALGVAQVVVSALVIALVAYLLGVGVVASAVIGGGLALSSTAIVLRLLSERGDLTSRFGRSAFAVLLVQDLAVAPFLVLVLALGQSELSVPAALGFALLKMVLAIMAILGIGRVVLRHAVWPISRLEDPEIFAALTLFVVLATGLLTKLAGLSMAFGAFLAGMLLAETRYRLQVAAEIQPFRGLLLGLFFMSVGMSIDLELTIERVEIIVFLVVALIVGKAALLSGLGRLFGLPWSLAAHLGVLLAQGGEFAFVLLGAAMAVGLIAGADGQLLVLVVAFTMMATPFLAGLGQGVSRRVERTSVVDIEAIPETTEQLEDHMIIAGFGRVGSAVASRFEAAGVAYIAVDLDPHRIAQARQRDLPVYFGDASRAEILAALHVERARAVVVAVDDPRAALTTVSTLHYIFPELKIYARARTESHATELERAGAHIVIPELVATGFKLATSILEPTEPGDAAEAVQAPRRAG